jgi:glutaryl-CoA dehydrogenase
VWQAEITLAGVRVPEENRRPGATSFKEAGRVLAGTRNAVAWGRWATPPPPTRPPSPIAGSGSSFGKPLVSFQIVQDRLVKMLAEVCSMQLYCLRLVRLIE